MSTYKNLHIAFKNKDDEHYTRYEDIEKELSHYFEFLKDKIVYCNCDDPRLSNFPRYFIRNFHNIGLKRLICTGYHKLSVGSFLDMRAEDIPSNSDNFSDADLNVLIDSKTGNLTGNGDYASYECISYLKESDVVVTNPPFSKFRSFFEYVVKFNKDFILLAPFLALGYNIVLPYVSTGNVKVSFLSKVNNLSFITPNLKSGSKSFRKVRWLTTLDIKQNTEFILCKYDSAKYPLYDGYTDMINVDHIYEIPDYKGIMGVPVTYLEHHNSELFEIVGFAQKHLFINGKQCFVRILIRRRRNAGDDGTESQSSQNGIMNWEDYQIKDLNTDVQTNLSNWV